MGQNVRGANYPWGEMSVGQYVRGAKCPWGEMSVGRNVRGARSRGASCPGASCLGASGPGTTPTAGRIRAKQAVFWTDKITEVTLLHGYTKGINLAK